uniref:Uncharacterized protein n=1 Tax=Arundo donax TaxID=35708 RepID=A0A0A9F2D6_ARUDO
MLQKLHTLSS